jgi:hypothetical protein
MMNKPKNTLYQGMQNRTLGSPDDDDADRDDGGMLNILIY